MLSSAFRLGEAGDEDPTIAAPCDTADEVGRGPELRLAGNASSGITATTTRAELNALFAHENVHDGQFEGGEVPEAATLAYESDSSAALAITWDRERPAAIHVCFPMET